MTAAEFESSGQGDIMRFIGNNRQQIKYDLSNDKTEVIVNIVADNKSLTITTYECLLYLSSFFAKQTDDEPDELKQIKILCSGKMAITNLIEGFRSLLPDRYDFSGFLNVLNSYIERAQVELQTKLLESQIKTNNSTVITNDNITGTNADILQTNTNIRETNVNTRRTNTTLKIIFSVTAIIYVLQLLASLGWLPNKGVDEKSHTLQQDSVIKTMEILLYQKDGREIYNLRQIDSLKTVLKISEDSLHHKPQHKGSHG